MYHVYCVGELAQKSQAAFGGLGTELQKVQSNVGEVSQGLASQASDALSAVGEVSQGLTSQASDALSAVKAGLDQVRFVSAIRVHELTPVGYLCNMYLFFYFCGPPDFQVLPTSLALAV